MRISADFLRNKIASDEDTPSTNYEKSEQVVLSLLAAVFESIHEYLLVINKDYEIILVNDELINLFSAVYKREVAEGMSILDVFPESGKDRWKERFDKVFSGKKLKVQEFLQPGSDLFHTQFIIKPVHLNGSVEFLVILGCNLKKENEHLQMFKEQQLSFKALADNLKSAVFTFDEEGCFTYVNQFMEKITGYQKAELMQKMFYEIIHPDHIELVKKLGFDRLNDKQVRQHYEIKIQTKEGLTRWVEVSNSRIILKKRVFVLGSAIDITDRKNAEEQLKIKTAYLENLFNNSPEAIVVTTVSGLITSVNKEFTTLFGYTEEEAVGQYVDHLITSGAKREEASEKTATVAAGKRIQDESIRMRKDGSEIHVSILGAPIEVDEELVAVYGIYRDITERIRYEKNINAAKEKAEESDRLKSAFLANMSHEIRTPMNAIMGFSRLLKDSQISGEQKNEFVNIIENRGNHLLKIINDIIDISKIESNQLTIQPKENNLNELLDEVYKLIQNELEQNDKHHIQLHSKKGLADHEAFVKLDKARFQQVLINLLNNAVKYTQQGNIVFGYRVVSRDENFFLEFFVEDTGIGISPKKEHIVFDRFRQSDESKTRAFGGTGLGLSISKAIVEMMKGTIWFKSKPEMGTIFYFTLPYVPTKKHSDTENNNDRNDMNYNWHGKRILIVEDDILSSKFLEAVLEDSGAHIFSVKNGSQAVEKVKNGEADLVLMDIQLPGMSGNEATMKIREFNTSIPVIAQTAHAMAEDKQKSIDAGCNDYVTKPINKELLMKKMDDQFKKMKS